MSDRLLYAAYALDEAAVNIIKAAVSERGWDEGMCFKGDIGSAVRALGAMDCPEILIVDLGDGLDPRSDMAALAEVCEPDTIVIALGSVNDVSLYRDLMQAGVHDYLLKPLDPLIVAEAISSAEDATHTDYDDETPVSTTSGHRVAVIGMRGGLGASTLATNLAWLRANKGENTILLDMDIYFGTSAMQFDLEPGRGLCDALENPDRVDSLFLERAVVKPSPNMAILGAEAPVGSLARFADGALAILVDQIAEHYQTVIIDAPRGLLGEHSEILQGTTDIILVSDRSLASVRDTIRLIAHIEKALPDTKVHIIQSKEGLNKDAIPVSDYESSVEHKINVTLPYEPKTTTAAESKGKLICDIDAGSKLAASMQAVSILLDSEATTETPKRSWIGKLMGQ